MGEESELGMYVCSSETRVASVSKCEWHQKLRVKCRIWLPCGKSWWKMWILMNPHHFMIMKIWDALNVIPNPMKQSLNSTQRCLSHVFLQKQLKNYMGGKTSLKDSCVVLRHGDAKKCVERYSEFHQFKQEELESVGELSEVCSQIVLTCLYVTRIGRPDILWSVNKLARSVTQWTQACDRRLTKADFLHSSYERFPTVLSCGKHGTALQTAFVSRLRLCWRPWGLKINCRWCLVFFWKSTFCPSQLGCARNKHRIRTVLQNQKLFLWMLDYVWMGYVLLIFGTLRLKFLRTIKDNSQPNHTGPKESWTVCDSNISLENRRLTNWVKWITYSPTHVLLKESLSCTSLKTTKHQRTKSHDETCVENFQSRSWLVVWNDQLGLQNLNQICWRQKSTCWHPNQRKFLERWVEAPAVFVEYHEFFRHILASIKKVFSLRPESALLLVSCRSEDKTQPRMMGLRWQKPDLPIWWCMISAKKMSPYKDRDLWSIRGMTTSEKRVVLATGNWDSSSSKFEVEDSPSVSTREG